MIFLISETNRYQKIRFFAFLFYANIFFIEKPNKCASNVTHNQVQKNLMQDYLQNYSPAMSEVQTWLTHNCQQVMMSQCWNCAVRGLLGGRYCCKNIKLIKSSKHDTKCRLNYSVFVWHSFIQQISFFPIYSDVSKHYPQQSFVCICYICNQSAGWPSAKSLICALTTGGSYLFILCFWQERYLQQKTVHCIAQDKT